MPPAMLFMIPEIIILFLSTLLAAWWIIKRSKNLIKLESIKEYRIMSSATDTKPRKIINHLINHNLYLHLPLVQALLFYLSCLALIWLSPPDASFIIAILALTAFSILSTMVNLFLPRWWLNTGLFLLSWFLLYFGLFSAIESRIGESLGAAAIGFFTPLMAAACFLPLTALIRLILFARRKSAD
jgi:hypothetical protein